MRLIRLAANHDSFHTVEFNPTGVTLIVGAQREGGAEHVGRTYNGVGKSLMVAILHFCLGSSSNKHFANGIPDWEFTLTFDHEGYEHTVSRSTSNQGLLILNQREYRVSEFRSQLERLLFDIQDPISGLTFRSLISHFIRPRRSSYIAFDQTESRGKDYDNLLRVAFLLGLDVALIQQKYQLRTEKERIRKLRTDLERDRCSKSFFLTARRRRSSCVISNVRSIPWQADWKRSSWRMTTTNDSRWQTILRNSFKGSAIEPDNFGALSRRSKQA